MNVKDMTDAQILEAALEGTLNEVTAFTQDEPQGSADDGNAADAAASQSTTTPAVTTAPTDAASAVDTASSAAASAADQEPAGAPILSKSGNYTIPYQKLAEARTERDALRAEVETLRQQIGTLTTQQQQNLADAQAGAQGRADAGQAQTQADANLAAATQALAQGVDMSVFGDFSEESIAKGVAEVNRRAMEQAQTQLRAEFAETLQRELAPLREERQERVIREAQTASSAHESAILQAYPHAYEIADSAEFDAWRNSLPAFARAGVDHAIAVGSSQQVIEVFDAFTKSQPKPQQQQQSSTQQTAPEASKPRVPVSLSDVPGAAPVDETQQTLAMAGNAGALLDRVSGMTREQIDALMDRI